MTNNKDFAGAPSPCYIMEEDKLRANLSLISEVASRSGVEFILAFKAFALWRSFPIFREYIKHSTASSPHEARLAYEEFGSPAHTYSPAYEDASFDTIMKCSSHITFNSLTQYAHFYPRVQQYNAAHASDSDGMISCGLRINPELSCIETALYDPSAPGSRFGITVGAMPDVLPPGVEGLHCHNHCESTSYALEQTLGAIERKSGKYLNQVKWLNLGGGHLLTREGYDVEHLISILTGLRNRYPHLSIILEPGSAFLWQTGVLTASVVDVVANAGIKTAILNVSFTCHMPDCLEMPYTPQVRGAAIVSKDDEARLSTAPGVYRLGGNSCLSGDFMGYWDFRCELSVGDKLIFEDMIHYTTVKTNMFNGVPHPSIALLHSSGELEMYRHFTYEDYKSRMC